MIEVGSVVKSKYLVSGHVARIGLVTKTVGKLAEVFWPHSRSKGWVKCEDMEVVNASR